MKGANYVIVNDKPGLIVIRDVGPWDHYGTVTNAAEGVVAELYRRGVLPAGKVLLYYDSENCLDQLRHDGQGRFTGYAPAPKELVPERQVGPRQVEHSEGAE